MTQRLSTNLRRPVVFGILIIGTLAGLSVYAAYRASDVVGQLDDSGQVIWTRGGVNGGPNDHGRSGSGGVTVDLVHHRLFVAEFSNARILVYALDGNNNLISHHAQNVIGQVDFVTVRSGVGPDRFLVGGSVFQVNMAYDPVHDRLFVVDSGNDRVLVFDTSNITNGMSASYVIGQSDLNSAGSHLAQNGLGWPTDVTYDAVHDRLFVTDLLYSRIMVYDMTNLGNGMNASYVIGQPNFGSAGIGTSSSTFQYVYGSTYDADNDRLFVSDLGNHRVLVFNVASGTIMNGMGAENVIGQSTFTASAASISATGFGEVYGLIYDTSSKRLFAADHFGNRVMIFNADPTVLTPFVTSTDGPSAINVLGQTDFVTAAGDTSQVKLSDPYTFAYDPGNQRLYVSERGNERVTVFDASTSTIVNGEPAQDVIGQLDDSGQPSYIQGGSNSGPNRIGFNLTSGSEGVLVDDVDHRLFVSDVTNQRVLVFGLDNTNALLDHQADFVIGQPNFSNGTSGLAADRLYRPSGMVLDQARHWLFLSDYVNNRVLIYDLTSLQNGPAAIHVLGQTDFISSSSAATAGQFRQPRGLAYDPVNQRLFVADALNNRVLVFDVSNVVDGQAAIHVLGQANFVSSSTATTQNGMNLPIELAYDTITRRLFVGEATNRRVTVWNADPATMTDGEPALHVLGQPNFTTAVQTTTASGLMEAFGLALVGANDVLWVADRANHRLVSYDVSPDNIVDGEPALAVIGQPDFVTTGASTSQTGMNFPSALGYDNTNGHLYVGETKNNRVLIFALPKLSGAYLSVGAQGSAYQEAVTTSNVQGTLSYAIATGTLPDGVVLNTSTGQLSGTPSSTGTFTFTIRALDNNGSNGTMVDSRVYTITIQPPHGGGESLPPAAPGSVVTMGPSNTSSGPSSGGVSPLASSTGSLPAPATCQFSLAHYLRRGYANDPNEVKKLQDFLKNDEGLSVDMTGIFDAQTEAAVKQFQEKYAVDILVPWQASQGTGIAYITTLRKMNELRCATEHLTLNLPPLLPSDLVPFSLAFGNGISTLPVASAPTEPIVAPTGSQTPVASASTPVVGTSGQATLTKDLSLAMVDPEVKLLQLFLNKNGYQLANYGPGAPGNETEKFGWATQYQLSLFQLAHKDELFVGRDRTGLGRFGPGTRALVNKLWQD